MIDTLVILFSTMMCVTVMLRAIWLDSRRPWFGPGQEDADGPRDEPAEAAGAEMGRDVS